VKTYRNLYPKIHTFSNLLIAFHHARKGKRHQPEVAAFEYNLEGNLLALERELASRTYEPGPYRSFYIYEPKRRLVSAAPFRDRVVHHALCNVIEPIWERRFIHDSYACRLGRGTHRALARCLQFVRRYPYVLQCDVRRFFPSVDHAILLDILAWKIADPDVLELCTRILQSSEGILAGEYEMVYFPGDDLFAAARPRGLPIGNLTSQFWANVYLDQLDQFVKRTLRCLAYLRYMDDFLLFANDKATLHAWRAEVVNFLVSLRLVLHPRKSVVFPVKNGVDFVGFRVFPTHVRLRRSSVRRFARRLRHLREAYSAGQMDFEQVNTSIRSWVAHASYANSYNLRRRLLTSVTWEPQCANLPSS
jgi:RNA-directed DNA polymerase